MKILVVTPKFPFPETGADEQDRAEGIRQLIRLGHEVHVLAKYFSWQDTRAIKQVAHETGFQLTLVQYISRKNPWRFLNPLWIDGAAYEYAESAFQKELENAINVFKPELGWLDHSECWPAGKFLKRHNVPVVARTVNIESTHFLQEEGRSLRNLLIFFAKHVGEFLYATYADALLAITPSERDWYKRFNKNTQVLPLRRLPKFLEKEHEIRDREKLNVIFTPSTYSVPHNRAAIHLIVEKVAPLAEKKYPGKFNFFVTGAKIPEVVRTQPNRNTTFVNPKPGTLGDFLEDMDIAIAPSLFGAGMQQKIFEPLVRGIPTVTSERGVGEYPFIPMEHYIPANSGDEFVTALHILYTKEARKKIASNARKLSQEIFSQNILDSEVERAIELALKSKNLN